MKIAHDTFFGMVPLANPDKLPPANALLARNCFLDRGVLEPIRAPLLVQSVPTGTKTIFRYNGTWLTWTEYADVVQGPIAKDEFDRIYITLPGSVPKVRGLVSGVLTEYNLGVPAPATAPGFATVAKSTTSWTRTWGYQYENGAGTVTQAGSLVEGAYSGANVHIVTAGSVYRIHTVPARTTASASDTFIAFFDAYDENGRYKGRMWPNLSVYVSNGTCYIGGAKVTGTQVNAVSSPQMVMTLSYDASLVTEYTADRSYVYTLVSVFGEESAPSPPTAVFPVTPAQDVQLSGLHIAAVAGSNIVAKRIYRTVSGASGTFYRYVDEIPLETATYTDTLDDATTNELLPSQDWDVPPEGLQGLVVMPGEFMAGFFERTVYFCEPNYPHAWPQYGKNVEHDIVGLAVVSNGLLILTKGGNYIAVGSHPAEIQVSSKVNLPQPCLSKNSIAIAGEGGRMAVYASPDGLQAFDGSTPIGITSKLYTRDQWQALEPDGLIGAVHDNRYIGFLEDGESIVVHLTNGNLAVSTTEVTAVAVRYDEELDALFIVQVDGADTNLMQWNAGDNLTLEWQSKEWLYPRPWSPNCARVLADNYPVSVDVYIEGQAFRSLPESTATRVMQADRAVRLPIMPFGRRLRLGVRTDKRVSYVGVSTNMVDV